MTTISVVTPSFNQGRFIERCISSVMAQNVPVLEHLVIDNCSTDETHDVLRRFPHVRCTSEPDHGQSDAINKGLRQARGDIIAWINADDYYLPGAFDVALRHLHNATDDVAIAGGVELVHAIGGLKRVFEPHFDGLDYLLDFWSHEYGLCQPGIFFRRRLLDKVGLLRTDLHFAMDYDFWLRIASSHRFRVVPERLAGYMLHDASKTMTRRHFTGFGQEMEQVSRRYWGSPMTRRYWRFALGCRRAIADLIVDEIVALHRGGQPPPARLLRELARRRPDLLLCRSLTAIGIERWLGPRTLEVLRAFAPRRSAAASRNAARTAP